MNEYEPEDQEPRPPEEVIPIPGSDEEDMNPPDPPELDARPSDASRSPEFKRAKNILDRKAGLPLFTAEEWNKDDFWINKLVMVEEKQVKVQQLFQEAEQLLTMEFEIPLDSHRSRQAFARHPSAFLVKKTRYSEVHYGKLSLEHKALLDKAKAKEVSSFIQNLNDKEIKEALGSGRILRARWVLVWKPTLPEDVEEVLQDVQNNQKTVYTKDGLKKAKARIVLLGHEHPDLGSAKFKTSSPVQSGLARHLLFQMVVQHDWLLEGHLAARSCDSLLADTAYSC